MFEGLTTFFKKIFKPGQADEDSSKNTAKERLHLVLMQDRANVSADFLELMKQEIIEVIKKYIDVDEGAIDVRLTNKENEDGTNGAPALYANIPILNIKNEARKSEGKEKKKEEDKAEKKTEKKKKEEDKTEKKTEKKKKEEDKTEKKHKEKKEEIEQNEEEPKETRELEKEENNEEEIKEIQNERIAKVILEARMYSQEKKEDKKEETNKLIIDDGQEEEEEEDKSKK